MACEDYDQSFWQLGLILSSGFGLVSMMVGAQISEAKGAGIAVTSIVLGNLILWFIGLGIISMTSERSHTIQNIKENLGKISTLMSAIVIVAAFIVWYALQIQIPVDALILFANQYIYTDENLDLRVSIALGISCALLGMGGIKIIKWVNILSFPLLIGCLLYFLYQSGKVVSFQGTWGISFGGILLVILTWFPGTVNLSTFFRYAYSRAHACLALTIMSIFHTLFQYGFLVIDISNPANLIIKDGLNENILHALVVVGFVILAFFCVNLLNIHWASVGWEVFFKHKQGAKGYAIIGLLGTILYVFFQSSAFIILMENVGTVFIASLGAVLIASYILKMVIRHRPRYIDKLSNSICWFFGCATAILFLWVSPKDIVGATLAGISASLTSFCIIMFIEEMTWSIKNLPKS